MVINYLGLLLLSFGLVGMLTNFVPTVPQLSGNVGMQNEADTVIGSSEGKKCTPHVMSPWGCIGTTACIC